MYNLRKQDFFKNTITKTDEEVIVITQDIFYDYIKKEKTIDNLGWIYELCKNPFINKIKIEYV